MYNKTPWKSWLIWTHLVFNVMLVLYVCLRVFVPLENVSLIWKCHHCRWWATSFDLWSALMVIEQWGFFSVTHVLWHGESVYTMVCKDSWHSHLLLSVWQWSCHYLFLRLRSVAAGIRTPKFRMRELRSNPLHHRRGYSVVFYFYRYWVNSTINICYRKCFKVHVIINV